MLALLLSREESAANLFAMNRSGVTREDLMEVAVSPDIDMAGANRLLRYLEIHNSLLSEDDIRSVTDAVLARFPGASALAYEVMES